MDHSRCAVADVSVILQFLFVLQHFSQSHCHCRFDLEHRSSKLGNVIEFPSSCTLLGSKRSIQLLRSTNATSVCKHDMCRNKCLPLLMFTSSRALPSKQISGPIKSPHAPATLHLVIVVRTSTHASPVVHWVSTQPFEFLHVSTPWLCHVSCEALHCFSNVNAVLSNIRQLHHQTAIQSRLR